jgi:hypothetical protein
MDMKRSTIGATVALVVAIGIGSAAAQELRVEGQYAGSSFTGNIDTNQDNFPASANTAVNNTNRGRFFVQGETEFLLPLATNVHCPTGVLELPLLQGRQVSTRENTGDQIFAAYTAGWQCYDPTTGNFTFHGEGDITGGMGKFAGVTGSLEDNATGTTLVSDPTGHGFFSFTGTLTMTLITHKDPQ